MNELSELMEPFEAVKKDNEKYSKPEYCFEIQGYKFEWCSLCRVYFLRCPKCGNNSCNGGWGSIDGGQGNCDECPKCYELEKKWRSEGKIPSEPTKNHTV